jgi:hypothetical protein
MPASKTQATEKSVYAWLTFVIAGLVCVQDSPDGLGPPGTAERSDIAEVNTLKIIAAKLKELGHTRL